MMMSSGSGMDVRQAVLGMANGYGGARRTLDQAPHYRCVRTSYERE
jgi:hypothetical protein